MKTVVPLRHEYWSVGYALMWMVKLALLADDVPKYNMLRSEVYG
jgi:hypothetical protein